MIYEAGSSARCGRRIAHVKNATATPIRTSPTHQFASVPMYRLARSLAAAALAPTSASAWGGWHGGWHHGWGWGGPHFYVGGPAYYGPAYSYGYGGCYVRRLAPTPWGPRWRLVNRCY